MKHLIGKAILTALVPVIACFSALAQTTPAAADRVHLKSGQTHEGIIVEQKPGESVRLWRTASADTLTFEMEEIDRITKILTAPPGAAAAQTPPPVVVRCPFNDHPWTLGVQFATGGGDYPAFGLSAALLKRFPQQHAALGLGIGYLGQEGGGVGTIPLTVQGTFEPASGLKGRLGAQTYLELGYSFNLGDQYFDERAQTEVRYGNGLHLNAGLRFRVNILRNTALCFDLGFARHTSALRAVATGDKVRTKAWNNILLRGSVFF